MNLLSIRSLLTCSLALAVASPATTQNLATESPSDQPQLIPVVAQSFGMDFIDGALRAGGPGYKAVLDMDGLEYTPALGAAAARNYPVRFTLSSIRRGENVLFDRAAVAKVAPQQKGMVASFARGNGVVETYEARADGIKQNFSFASAPAGVGDLIVEGRITTDLHTSQPGANDQGIEFHIPGIGGVYFGAVLAIDALGGRVAGGQSYDGDLIRFTLPSTYVDRAAYPMVLDPLIATMASVSASPAADPDVGWNAHAGECMVVWEHQFSQADLDIRGQRVDMTGALVGSMVLWTNESGLEINPSVCNVRGYASPPLPEDWVVVFQDGNTLFGPWDIRGRRMNSYPVFGAAVSPIIDIAASPANEINPDCSGTSGLRAGLARVAIVVFDDSTGISCVSIDMTTFTLWSAPHTLDASPGAANPAINDASGSTSGRFLAVWERDYGTDRDVHCGLVGAYGAVNATSVVAATVGVDEFNAVVDGGVNAHLVAYQQHEVGNTGPSDIYCRFISAAYSTFYPTPPAVAFAATPNIDERDPAVGQVRMKNLVAWAYEASAGSLDYDIAYAGVDPDSCLPCGHRTQAVGGGSTTAIKPAIATRVVSTNPSALAQPDLDEAMLVWMEADLTPPFNSSVVGNVIESFGDNPVVDLGGGCGNGGTNNYNGPVALGNWKLRLLSNSPTQAIHLVSVMFSDSTVPCGSCQINSDLLSFIMVTPALSSSGYLALPIPCDPNLAGVQLFTQWANVFSGASSCAIMPPSLEVSFSNRTSVTISN